MQIEQTLSGQMTRYGQARPSKQIRSTSETRTTALAWAAFPEISPTRMAWCAPCIKRKRTGNSPPPEIEPRG